MYRRSEVVPLIAARLGSNFIFSALGKLSCPEQNISKAVLRKCRLLAPLVLHKRPGDVIFDGLQQNEFGRAATEVESSAIGRWPDNQDPIGRPVNARR